MPNYIPGPQVSSAAQASNEGTNNSNLYINIAAQGTGTLTGAEVDPKLVKADRLLAYGEHMSRNVNSAAENLLFSAGQIDASWVYAEILRTQASIFVQNSFFQANNIGPITIFRADVINGKMTVTEEIQYTNNIITKVQTDVVALQGKKMDTLKFWFRFTQRQDTLLFFDQKGMPLGQDVSLIDFTLGTLKAAAAGGATGGAAGGDAAGGDAGGAAAGGDAGGGDAGGGDAGGAAAGGAGDGGI